jgi:hypothetical protein
MNIKYVGRIVQLALFLVIAGDSSARFVGSDFFDVTLRPEKKESSSRWSGMLGYAAESISLPNVGPTGPFTAEGGKYTGEASTIKLNLAGPEWWQYLSLSATSTDELFPSSFGSASKNKITALNQVDGRILQSKGWRPGIRIGTFNLTGALIPYPGVAARNLSGALTSRIETSLEQTYAVMEWNFGSKDSTGDQLHHMNYGASLGLLRETASGAFWSYTANGNDYTNVREGSESKSGGTLQINIDYGFGRIEGLMFTFSTNLRYDIAYYDTFVAGYEVGLNWMVSKRFRIRPYAAGYFATSSESVFTGNFADPDLSAARLSSDQTVVFGLQASVSW